MSSWVGYSRYGVEVLPEQVMAADCRSSEEWLAYLYQNPHLLIEYAGACEEALSVTPEERSVIVHRLRKNEGISIPPMTDEMIERQRISDSIRAEVCSLSQGLPVLADTLARMANSVNLIRAEKEREFMRLFYGDADEI